MVSSAHPASFEILTPVEREIATLALTGAADQKIAEERGCSRRTVENHIRSIYRKLSIRSRGELAALLDPLAQEPSQGGA